jgi:23S rRNA (adenine2030-N6)-methyltransferase
MNYRHAFHAGNFADVFKHAVLALIIMHLREKPAPFRVIDTHAGAARYDLAGPEATRTGEWQDGIGRLYDRTLDPALRDLLAPYLDVVASNNAGDALTTYPGSPEIARALLRAQDRLLACELEPGAARALASHLHNDRRAKAVTIDGWTALSAYIPPIERRGIVLVDPPFEVPNELARLQEALVASHRKWPTGIYMLWYPIKDRRQSDAFARRLAGAGLPKILRAELMISATADPERLNGSGLVIVNPPWRLEAQLAILLPKLAAILAHDGKGAVRLDWLAREK